MDTTAFLTQLDQHISDKHLLTHDFYKAWSHGALSVECLRDYASQYYHHVKAFPCYLSALHSHTEDAKTRKHLLQNLVDEEAGSPNHPEMWRTFAKRLGATDEQLDSHEPQPAMSTLIETFKKICHEGSTAEGLAALYAYESQIPAVSESKIDGLKTHYNLKDPTDWLYFTVHIDADKEHAAIERALLAQHISSSNAEKVLKSADLVLERLWNFLSSLCAKYQVLKCA